MAGYTLKTSLIEKIALETKFLKFWRFIFSGVYSEESEFFNHEFDILASKQFLQTIVPQLLHVGSLHTEQAYRV